MALAVLTPLLMAGAALSAADRASVEARVREIFAPYSQPPTPRAAWEMPVFSAETTALIARWKRVQPEDEPDALNDGDWFCLCQDYDEKSFRVAPGAVRLVRPEVAEIVVQVHIGWGTVRSERLVFRREAGAWRLHDLYAAPDFPRGLKQKLRATIAEDEALRR